MFNEYTNSNAEAEHSALKSSGVGIQANGTLADVAAKSFKHGERRSTLKTQKQATDLHKTDTETYCDLSTSVVRNAFEQVRLNLELSRSCVSKRVDSKQWYVFYCRNTQRVPSTYEFPTPVVLRLRSVTIDACKYNISFLLMVTITSIKMLASHIFELCQ